MFILIFHYLLPDYKALFNLKNANSQSMLTADTMNIYIFIAIVTTTVAGGGKSRISEEAALKDIIKKVEERHQFSWSRSGQIKSQTSPRCRVWGPSASGASGSIVSRLSRLKLGGKMGTHPGRSLPMLELGTLTLGLRGLKNWVQCSVHLNRYIFGKFHETQVVEYPWHWFGQICKLLRDMTLQQARNLQRAWASAAGLDYATGTLVVK